jgi:hypothetical protein
VRFATLHQAPARVHTHPARFTGTSLLRSLTQMSRPSLACCCCPSAPVDLSASPSGRWVGCVQAARRAASLAAACCVDLLVPSCPAARGCFSAWGPSCCTHNSISHSSRRAPLQASSAQHTPPPALQQATSPSLARRGGQNRQTTSSCLPWSCPPRICVAQHELHRAWEREAHCRSSKWNTGKSARQFRAAVSSLAGLGKRERGYILRMILRSCEAGQPKYWMLSRITKSGGRRRESTDAQKRESM